MKLNQIAEGYWTVPQIDYPNSIIKTTPKKKRQLSFLIDPEQVKTFHKGSMIPKEDTSQKDFINKTTKQLQDQKKKLLDPEVRTLKSKINNLQVKQSKRDQEKARIGRDNERAAEELKEIKSTVKQLEKFR